MGRWGEGVDRYCIDCVLKTPEERDLQDPRGDLQKGLTTVTYLKNRDINHCFLSKKKKKIFSLQILQCTFFEFCSEIKCPKIVIFGQICRAFRSKQHKNAHPVTVGLKETHCSLT